MPRETAWKPVMDLSKDGLLMFFKPYQLHILEALWATEESYSSRQCWEAIDKEKSSASVINFLNAVSDEGLLELHEITGKEGYRGMYRPAFDRAGAVEFLKKSFSRKGSEF